MTARWPMALGVSALVHGLVGLAVFLTLGHRPATVEPPASKTRPLEVLRVGALLPRAVGAGAGALATTLPASAQQAASGHLDPYGGTRGAPAEAPQHTVAPANAVGSAEADPASARRTSAGDTSAGDTSAGDTSAGDTSAGDTSAGDTSAGDTSAGDTSAGDTSTGRTSAGDTVGHIGSGAPGGRGDGAAAATGTSPGSDPTALAVHARLRAAARECYPARARRFRYEGRVPVAFCVSARGAAERVVVTPSGQALLDEATEGCVLSRAAPFPMTASGQCFAVNVEFSPEG